MYDPQNINPPIEDPMTLAPASLKQQQASMLPKIQSDWWRYIRAAYYGQISLIDDGIAMMLETLEKRGMLDNTIIVYSADHGEMLCDHGLMHKMLMYESSAGVPMIIRYPRLFKQNLKPQSAVSTIDIAPTLLDIVGASPLPDAHGRSLTPILTGQTDDRDETFSEFMNTRMIRKGPWKYVCNSRWDVQQLFNLDDDPDEVNNLVNDKPDVANQLHERIDKWLLETT